MVRGHYLSLFAAALLLWTAVLCAQAPCSLASSYDQAPCCCGQPFYCQDPCCSACCDDEYLQGYLQALVDTHFHDYRVRVRVVGSTVYLTHLPNNRLVARSICRYIQNFPEVGCLIVDHTCRPRPRPRMPTCKPWASVNGIWFPEAYELFQALIADPRQITFSAAWRFHDDIVHHSVAAVVFGDTFPIFRWLDIWPCHGDLQIGIEGGVFAIFLFDPDMETQEGDSVALVNSDYYVALPIVTYACGNWSYRGRLYHVSSHLGDEFVITHTEIARKNPSREAVDLFASYQLTPWIRLYGGVGYNWHSNQSFFIKPWYIEYGAELRVLGQHNLYHCLYFQPFLAMDFQNWEYTGWKFSATYCLGVEVSQLEGIGKKLRIFLEYHDGYSVEGQFAKLKTHYLAARISWGY